MKSKCKLIAAAILSCAIFCGTTFFACKKATPQDTEEAHVEDIEDTEDIEEGTEAETPADTENTEEEEESQTLTAAYIRVNGDGVYIRRGASVSYSALGVAEKDCLYAYLGAAGNWLKTVYRNKDAYIYADYCSVVNMDMCESDKVEEVIACGLKYLGTSYVYGAVRYHDGYGNLISGFSEAEFDCSSLMQYIFKIGAGINLQVNTRTQVYQGAAVSSLLRGDLLFFTNSARKSLSGVERIGHVGLYLGGNYILHTASDYAKIEKISDERWNNFICARRIIG